MLRRTFLPQREFGTTGVSVSVIGLGGGGGGMNPQIIGYPDKPHLQALAEQIIHRALDLGINLFDTCSGYGASELILGRVAAIRRSEMFLSTKNNLLHAPGDQVRRELEQSLTRLRSGKRELCAAVLRAAIFSRVLEPNHRSGSPGWPVRRTVFWETRYLGFAPGSVAPLPGRAFEAAGRF